jgi:hypothetical protein
MSGKKVDRSVESGESLASQKKSLNQHPAYAYFTSIYPFCHFTVLARGLAPGQRGLDGALAGTPASDSTPAAGAATGLTLVQNVA